VKSPYFLSSMKKPACRMGTVMRVERCFKIFIWVII
jgi:hypothetical protein